MTLRHINYDTDRAMYCGPTAICAVTGKSARMVLHVIEAGRGERAINARGVAKGVRGMHISEVVAVLTDMGFQVQRRSYLGRCPTVAQYCETMFPERANCPRIIRIRGHFMAVSDHGKTICDTGTKQPVPAKQARFRRARVTDDIIILGPFP
jgi:hypothetical protein